MNYKVMMISTPNVIQKNEEEQFTESDIDEDELGEEEEDMIDEELEEEEYSEEIVDEFEAEFKSRVPQTFEEFHNMYKPQSEHIEEAKRKVTFDEPKAVEQEVENELEERILALPESSTVQATQKIETPKTEQTEKVQTELDYEPNIDIEDEELGEEEEELEEEEEMSGKLQFLHRQMIWI
jgi:2-oxoglutarate dehydrogenase complex dehydrogenase (E1) component-like enzyme